MRRASTRRKAALSLWMLLAALVLGWVSPSGHSTPTGPTAARALPARLTAAVHPAATQRMVTLTIVTVPHLPNARFEFDGQIVQPDYKGVVRLSVVRGRKPHNLRLVNPTISSGETQAQFVRWWGQPIHDQDYQPRLTKLVVDRNLRLEVAFRVSYLVHYKVVDQNHQSIKLHRIQQIVFRSDTGNLISVHGGEVRLIGYRPALEGGSMAERQAVFSLWAIMIDGSNAVHQGQKRFIPSLPQDRQLEFVVPLKSIHITASDRIFGWGVGKAVILTFPDHTRVTIPFGKGHDLTIRNLVRGNYQIRLVGSQGLGGTRPLALSRNLNVALRVWNLADAAVILGVVLVLGATSILGGRLGQSGRHQKKPTQERVR